MVKRGIPKAVVAVSLVLKLLSTRLGTLFLCGGASLDWRWPFIHKFSELSISKREGILKKWSRGTLLLPLRTVFFMLKVTCFFTFFSLVIKSPVSLNLHLISNQTSHLHICKLTADR